MNRSGVKETVDNKAFQRIIGLAVRIAHDVDRVAPAGNGQIGEVAEDYRGTNSCGGSFFERA